MATVIDEATGERVAIGRFREKHLADRASIVKALQPGFCHAQVKDAEEPSP